MLRRILLGVMAIILVRGKVILRVTIIPIAISFGADLAVLYMEMGFLAYFAWILDWVLFVFVAVSIHRACLTGEASLPAFGTLTSPGKADAMYFLTALLICGFLLIAGTGLSFVANLTGVQEGSGSGLPGILHFFLNWGTLLILLILAARMALWLPAVALDHKFKPLEIWNFGRGNTLIILATVIVIPGLFTYLFSFPANALVHVRPFNFILRLLPGLLAVMLLSLTYAEIARERGEWREAA